jgi:hypothetical protein
MIRIYLYPLFLTCLGLLGVAGVPAHAQTATTVTLAPLPTSTVAAGTVVALVASVGDAGGPVLIGEVTFFDGTKAIGTVSVVRNAAANYLPGTATLRKIFGPGGHSFERCMTAR